jgi:hypothetical protein
MENKHAYQTCSLGNHCGSHSHGGRLCTGAGAAKRTGFARRAGRQSGKMPSSKSGAQSSALHELKDGNSKVGTLNNIAVKDLNDYAIYGSDGKKIGDIDRVLADNSNKAKAVAVDAGGFLGMGSHEVVFPLDKLSKGKDAKQLTTAMTKDQIKGLEKWEDASNDAKRTPSTASGAGGQPATSVPKR